MLPRRLGYDGIMLLAFLAMLALGVIVYVVQRAVRERPAEPPPPPPLDAQIERVLALGAPPSQRFQIDNQRSPYLAGFLGPGTPDFGPAPPSVSFEPDQNVVQVDDPGPPPLDLPMQDD